MTVHNSGWWWQDLHSRKNSWDFRLQPSQRFPGSSRKIYFRNPRPKTEPELASFLWSAEWPSSPQCELPDKSGFTFCRGAGDLEKGMCLESQDEMWQESMFRTKWSHWKRQDLFSTDDLWTPAWVCQMPSEAQETDSWDGFFLATEDILVLRWVCFFQLQ